jgi:hypothetical protein
MLLNKHAKPYQAWKGYYFAYFVEKQEVQLVCALLFLKY